VLHRGHIYPGQHQAIVDPDIFSQVQELITANAPDRRQAENQTSPHLLTGLLFDETGDALSPTHAVKKGKRYRYYTSHRLKSEGASASGGWRLSADQMEQAVIQLLTDTLSDQDKLMNLFSDEDLTADRMTRLSRGAGKLARGFVEQTKGELKAAIKTLVHRVELKAESIAIQIRLAGLIDLISAEKPSSLDSLSTDATRTIHAPLQIKKRGVETKLVIGDRSHAAAELNQALVMLVAQAHHWLERLTAEPAISIIELSREEQVDKNKISRALRFAFLAPDIIQAIVEGRQPVELTADRLRRLPDLPMDWQDQRILLGFI
jgi:hypothetical protein